MMHYSKKRKPKSQTSGRVLTCLRVLWVLLQNFLECLTDGDEKQLIGNIDWN